MISVIGPAAAEVALGGPAGPEHAHREVTRRRRRRASPPPPTSGVDLLVAADRGARGARRAQPTAGAEPVDEAAAEIVRVESGRPRFGRRDDDRDDPPGGGDQRARRETSPRAATSARRPSPACTTRASPTATCAACGSRGPAATAIPCAWASASSGPSGRPSSPPPAGRSRSRSCAARPSPAATVEVGDGNSGRGRRAAVLSTRSGTGRPHVELGLRPRWAHGRGGSPRSRRPLPRWH